MIIMQWRMWSQAALVAGLVSGWTVVTGCEQGEGPIVPPPPPPPEYADKHMPAGWWDDEKIIQEGRQIFIGAKNPDVNCGSCHGKNGKPVKAGARDFRNTQRMKLYSDSVLFWRVSEGVLNTKMKPWKSKLPEEDRWKVIAFVRTFGLKDMVYDPAKKEWVPIGSVTPPGAAPATGPAGGSQAPAGKASVPAPVKPGQASTEKKTS